MSKKKTTQAGRVLAYIEEFGSISRVEAMMDISVANLTAVIDIIRNKLGKNIVTNRIKTKNRYGESVSYARYTIAEDDR
jgi:hypothetical protein